MPRPAVARRLHVKMQAKREDRVEAWNQSGALLATDARGPEATVQIGMAGQRLGRFWYWKARSEYQERRTPMAGFRAVVL